MRSTPSAWISGRVPFMTSGRAVDVLEGAMSAVARAASRRQVNCHGRRASRAGRILSRMVGCGQRQRARWRACLLWMGGGGGRRPHGGGGGGVEGREVWLQCVAVPRKPRQSRWRDYMGG